LPKNWPITARLLLWSASHSGPSEPQTDASVTPYILGVTNSFLLFFCQRPSPSRAQTPTSLRVAKRIDVSKLDRRVRGRRRAAEGACGPCEAACWPVPLERR
jgi:hypothetical protein